MFLSKAPNGYWYLYYTDSDGKRNKVSSKSKNKSDAIEFLRTYKKESRVVKKSYCFKDFASEFLTFAQKNFSPGNVDLYRKAFHNFHCLFGDISLNKISPLHWDKFKVERKNNSNPARSISSTTINIELRCLKAALNTAVRWKYLLSNPFQGLKTLTVPEKSPVFFSKTELQTLWHTIKHDWLKEIMLFAVLTGVRQGEILIIKWSDIDFQNEIIHIRNSATYKTKTGKNRVIPLSGMVRSLLQSKQRIIESDLVFTIDGRKIRRDYLTVNFKRSIKAAGISNRLLHFHSLRHTFASWLVQSGTSIYEVQKLLGHSSIQVTQVYSHLLPNNLLHTVNGLSTGLTIDLKNNNTPQPPSGG